MARSCIPFSAYRMFLPDPNGPGLVLLDEDDLDSLPDKGSATGRLIDTAELVGPGKSIPFADIHLVCRFRRQPMPNSALVLWLVEEGKPEPDRPVLVVPVDSKTVDIEGRIFIPTCAWRPVLKNEAGEALTSTGNMLCIRSMARHVD